jgi:uncharacterized protein (DUF1501 family)
MRRRRKSQETDEDRREFLWKGACAALTATGIASSIWDLRLINAAAAHSIRFGEAKKAPTANAKPKILPPGNGSNYKALVCIFLFGGNDGNNLLIPNDSRYAANYQTPRGVLAIPQAALLPLNPVNAPNGGGSYGLHPSLTEVAALFNSGQAAVLANVGTLLAPITKAQYNAHSVAVPPQLFSHQDQQIEWQTSIEDQPPATGWGGRSADLLYSLNTNNNVSMNISLAGTNTFEVGNVINEYAVSTSGAISLNIPTSGTGPAQLQALKDLIAMNHTNLYESAFASQMTTAINDATLLNAAIAPTASSSYWTTPFSTTSLGSQMKTIARLIQAAPALGHNRQIFFASIGGFDLHSTEGNNAGAQANLFRDLSSSMNALYQATVQLGVSQQVTQFTASDFSRTFPVNGGQGTDHGWGNHHLIVGGGVVGQNIYGTFPTLAVSGPDDTTTGRWIPTTSVDQYSATLAKWFGVSTGNMSSVFPYIGRFATADLGFMG